jgi:hypothetical protein
MKRNYHMKIDKTGTIRWLTPPPVEMRFMRVTKQRFSEIVPLNLWLLVAFRILRLLFGEKGVVSDWTRTWPCRWKMKILSTGYTTTGTNRQALVDLEHEIFSKPKLNLN